MAAGESSIAITEAGHDGDLRSTGSFPTLFTVSSRCRSVPVLSNGILDARTAAGDVVALEVKP